MLTGLAIFFNRSINCGSNASTGDASLGNGPRATKSLTVSRITWQNSLRFRYELRDVSTVILEYSGNDISSALRLYLVVVP